MAVCVKADMPAVFRYWAQRASNLAGSVVTVSIGPTMLPWESMRYGWTHDACGWYGAVVLTPEEMQLPNGGNWELAERRVHEAFKLHECPAAEEKV